MHWADEHLFAVFETGRPFVGAQLWVNGHILNAFVAHLAEDHDLLGGIGFMRECCGSEFEWEVCFHVGTPIADDAISHRVRTVERPSTVCAEIVPNLVEHWAIDALFARTSLETVAELVEIFFAERLGHRFAEGCHVFPSQVTNVAADLHDLFLIGHDANRCAEIWLEKRMRIFNLGTVLALHPFIGTAGSHRPWTRQGCN